MDVHQMRMRALPHTHLRISKIAFISRPYILHILRRILLIFKPTRFHLFPVYGLSVPVLHYYYIDREPARERKRGGGSGRKR